MTDALMYCKRCERIGPFEENRCRSCGEEIKADNQNIYFFSELLVPQGKKALVLSPATILTDRFRIIKHIDTGRYGSVHLAEDLLSSMQIALKVTNMGSQCGETGVSQLKREMAVYSKITNFQHVIKVYGIHFVPWEGTSLLVLSMEYADGGTFRKWLIDHRKDLEARRTEGLHYFRDACLGIKASHWEGIVHHDVKPENLVFVNGVFRLEVACNLLVKLR